MRSFHGGNFGTDGVRARLDGGDDRRGHCPAGAAAGRWFIDNNPEASLADRLS